MKLVCAFCGHANAAATESCTQCGGSLANARAQKLKLPWASWVPALPIAALLCFQIVLQRQQHAQAESRRHHMASGHRLALDELRAEQKAREDDMEQQHQATLNNTQLISGELASRKHADEWKRRQSHDPAVARTLMEKTLLEVERVGKDSNLTAETALRRVAELVTPPRSRIEITKADNGFIVRVAFRLSAVRPEESGGATHHGSSAEMRAEIEHITAQVVKDIFDSCGARGIERLSVSCNRAVVIGTDEAQRLVMRSLYRAAVSASDAASIARWRDISDTQIANVMRVEHDVVSGILINKTGGRRLVEDPNEPLEF